jgi:thiol-disulfide isomerase/thioredoxin
VFVAAAVGKLADRGGFRTNLVGFGIPAPLAAPLAALLPAIELATAATLIAAATAWYGALAALALLVGFLIALGANLAVGRTPPCHCFGAGNGDPIGARTLARTGTLALLAAVPVALGRADLGADPPARTVTFLAGADALAVALGAGVLGLLAACVVLALALIGSHGRLLLRIEALERQLEPAPAGDADRTAHGLSVGASAPPFAITDRDGHALTLDHARAAGRPVVLIFTDPDCGPCQALRPELESWRRRHADALTLVVLDRGRDVAHDYHVRATPTAITVAADGTIATRPALGAPAIAELITHTAAAPAEERPHSAPPHPHTKPGTATRPAERGRPPRSDPTAAEIRTGTQRGSGSTSPRTPVTALTSPTHRAA